MQKIVKASLSIIMLLTATAFAQDNLIAERQAKFKENGMALRAMRAHLQNGDFDAIGISANQIAAWAGEMTDFFPEGSGSGKTNALPAIWERLSEFSALADDNRLKALALADAANAQDAGAVQGAMGALGKTCGACHSQFKK